MIYIDEYFLWFYVIQKYEGSPVLISKKYTNYHFNQFHLFRVFVIAGILIFRSCEIIILSFQ